MFTRFILFLTQFKKIDMRLHYLRRSSAFYNTQQHIRNINKRAQVYMRKENILGYKYIKPDS